MANTVNENDVVPSTVQPIAPTREKESTVPVADGNINAEERNATQNTAIKPLWRKKRFYIPAILLTILVLFAIIFGSVYGTLQSRKTSPAVETPLGKSGYGWSNATTSPNKSPTKTTSTPTPSNPTQSPFQTPIPTDIVPRDLGLATGKSLDSFIVWDLQKDGTLWANYHNWDPPYANQESGQWFTNSGQRRFLVAPICVRTGESTQTAFSVDAHNGHVLYLDIQDDQEAENEWKELDMPCCLPFIARPAVVSRAEGTIDIFNVDSQGYIFTNSFNGEWSGWTEVPGLPPQGIVREVAATSWGEDRMDVFITTGSIKQSGVLHTYWTIQSGWLEKWEDWEGIETRASPRVFSWQTPEGDGTVDVVAVEDSGSDPMGGGLTHKRINNNFQSDWITMFASHEGYEFTDTQSLMLGDPSGQHGPVAHLVSRGTDNCIHYNSFNGTDWDFWTFLWCMPLEASMGRTGYPTQGMSTMAVGGRVAGTGHILARDLEGTIIRYQVDGVVNENIDNGIPSSVWEALGKGGN